MEGSKILRKFIILSYSVVFGVFAAGLAMAEEVQLNSPITATDFGKFFGDIAKGAAAIIGPAAGLMIVISGVLFVTSGGSPERLKTAKTCLTYAIAGAVIAILAGTIAATLGSIF